MRRSKVDSVNLEDFHKKLYLVVTRSAQRVDH
jgi:hypothetical protein